MKAFFPILLCVAMTYPAIGQSLGEDAELTDKVQKAILEFNKRKENTETEPAKEVTVVLPLPETPPDQEYEVPPLATPVEEDAVEGEPPAESKPRLVTGKPPAGEPEETPAELSEGEPAAPVESLTAETEGLGIRVEPIREGKNGAIPGEIKLKASFPAKALSTTPDGWVLDKSVQAPAFIEEVNLRPGKTVSLSISPHVLTPAADGENTFGVVEPGFDSSKGYLQTNTVSAILGNSIVQLDRDALLLGTAISDLHQLLASLPKPEPEPEQEDSTQP
jgi:hypothetical protein